MKPTAESPDNPSDGMKYLMTEYHKSHVNRTNQQIHYVCVPLIFWSISALMWAVKIPYVMNLAWVVTGLLMLYYLLKSVKVFGAMLVFTAACLALNHWLEIQSLPLAYIALVVFVAAWIGQFIGHHIEGQKPSFYKDLQFLLIGPAWVVFKWFNIRL